MYNIGMVLECYKCNKEIVSEKENDEHSTIIKFSFKDGIIEYVCPFCLYLNQMKFIKDSKMKEMKTLPKSQFFRG